jgi:hypothetical protein
VKSLNVRVSLIGLTMFLLLAASLTGFVMPTTALASLPIDDTTITTDGGDTSVNNTTMSENNMSSSAATTIDLADEPFAVGHYRSAPTNISETQVQFTIEGNTTITLPNSTETITTRDTGQGNVTFLPGGGANVIRGQIHMTTEDGSENATADFTEYMKGEESTGVGVAYFSTSSTGGILTPLNNMIAVYLDEIQPNQDSIVRFFEWKSGGGAHISNENSTTIGGGNDNTTMTTTETPVILTP